MNKIKTWIAENKGPSVLVAVFLVLAGGAGWFAYSSWDAYASVSQTYSDAMAKLVKTAKQTPPPTEANLMALSKSIDAEQSSLNQLLDLLERYAIPVFQELDKAKPQDAPQLFQDALRAQVTKLKSQAASSSSTLPPGFYLGLEDYENRLPAPEETITLAKQLTVYSWIAEQLTSHFGLIVAEFSKVAPPSSAQAKPDVKKTPSTAAQKTELPYDNLATLKVSFRCDQGSLREILNSFSKAPYFLVIDSLQLQNSVPEPTRRDAPVDQTQQANTNPGQDGQASVQRIPIVVGREQINVSMRIRILNFPEVRKNTPSPAK